MEVDIGFAVAVCKEVESAISHLNCHVALTGGALYKRGMRKDLDLLFYRVRQAEHPSKEEILGALKLRGFEITDRQFNWCVKSKFYGADVDLFFPELHPEIAPDGEEY